MQAIVGLHQTESTYALVEVDGVFAGDDVGDGAAATLAGGLLCCWGHCLRENRQLVVQLVSQSVSQSGCGRMGTGVAGV
jgi:hypothetical protein